MSYAFEGDSPASVDVRALRSASAMQDEPRHEQHPALCGQAGWVECEVVVPHGGGGSIGLVVLPDLTVEEVDPRGALARHGVAPGMVLVGVNGTRVTSDEHALGIVSSVTGPFLRLNLLAHESRHGVQQDHHPSAARMRAAAAAEPPPRRPTSASPPGSDAAGAVPRMFAAMAQPEPEARTDFTDNEVSDRVERLLAAAANRRALEQGRAASPAQQQQQPPPPEVPQHMPRAGHVAGVAPRLSHLSGAAPASPVWSTQDVRASPYSGGRTLLAAPSPAPEHSVPRSIPRATGAVPRRTPAPPDASWGPGSSPAGSAASCCDQPHTAFCKNTGMSHAAQAPTLPARGGSAFPARSGSLHAHASRNVQATYAHDERLHDHTPLPSARAAAWRDPL
eukprot:Rhum_TRINITY_DN11475_c0_g1::Rhum_TRINITY_DN11475_c0_g1_i1::g.44854::m.44854